MSNTVSKGWLHAENDRWSESTYELPLRAGVYALISFAVLLVFIFLGETEFSAYFAATLAIAAAFVVWRSNRARPRSRLITVFFCLAAAHAIFGYWAAGPSADRVSMGSNAEEMFRRSLFIIGATLLVAAFTYDIALSFPPRKIQRFCLRLQVSEQKLIRLARVFLVVGCVLVIYVSSAVGFMPILTSNPGVARYFSSDLTASYREYEAILSLGVDLLTCAIPLVLLSGVDRRNKTDWLLGLAGGLAVLSSLRRGSLASVVVVVLLVFRFVKGRFPRRYLAYVLFLVVGYFGSQLVFLNALGESVDSQVAMSASLSGLPEVRDLGWVMSLVGERRLYGATYATLIPLLGQVTEFKIQNALTEITKRLIGLEGMGMTGGLRITAGGEGFLNFGVLGCLIIGVIFGGLCACLSHVNDVLLKKRDLASSYLAAFLFVWLCFWFYLAGTEATGAIRNGLILIFVMFYLARVKRVKQPVSATPAG
jgi:hypothetical protein